MSVTRGNERDRQIHPAFGADVHVGRDWSGSMTEDACPCEKAPCGLVIWSRIEAECKDHALRFARPLRQVHTVDECGGM